jgi:hypothetical protein
MQKALPLALFCGLLLLAFYLRVTGLGWGLNSGYGHELNFQPDEFISLRGVLQLDLSAGRIKAPAAYFEGTFNYYLWAIPQAILKTSHHDNRHLASSMGTKDIANLLYICRWMSVVFDAGAVVVVFLAIREATRTFYPSLIGAVCYAVLPMQVIYAHFMRTHILSNLLCALVIWLSLMLKRFHRWQLLLALGLISGLGAAARYPVGIIIVVPCLYLLFDRADQLQHWKTRIWANTKDLLSGPFWAIVLGFLIGLFLGHPMLFLDPVSVTRAIANETLPYASLNEFSVHQLFNLSVILKYITYAIPFVAYPFLWLIFAGAILYLVFRPHLYHLALPILIFSFLYLYFMGKGYHLRPYFGRVTMLLFPGLCVLVGLACADLQAAVANSRGLLIALTCALLLIIGPTIAFDIAYGLAMRQTDARELLQQDLRRLIGSAPATVGISRYGPYFYTSMPAVRPLSSDKVTVRVQDPEQSADFFVIGFERPIQPAMEQATIQHVEARGQFEYQKTYSVPIKIFGYQFRLARFPPDMAYPFPTLLLFRSSPAGT